MARKDKLFGDFLSPSFNQLMGKAPYPITRTFHYLVGFNTAHFSRERRGLFLNGTLQTDDAEEFAQQSFKSVRSEGDATLDNDTKSDVSKYEKRLELFDIYADSRLSQDAFDPNVAPKWIFNKRVAEVVPSRLLRLMSFNGVHTSATY